MLRNLRNISSQKQRFSVFCEVGRNRNCTVKNCPTPALSNRSVRNKIYVRMGSQKTCVCWKCGEKKKTGLELFCAACNSIQNPHNTTNYFALLGIDERYAIDNKRLTQIHREMQNVLHPDKYSNRCEEEQVISEKYSSLVNHAYNTLASRTERAFHLLRLKGHEVTEDDRITDTKFLLEIMDINEEVECADTIDKIDRLEATNRERLNLFVQQIDRCFKDKDVSKAKELILRMQCYCSVAEHIAQVMDDMGYIEYKK